MPASRWLLLLRGYALAILVTLALTLLMYPLRQQLNTTTIALLYLLPITLNTTLWGLGLVAFCVWVVFLLWFLCGLSVYATHYTWLPCIIVWVWV